MYVLLPHLGSLLSADDRKEMKRKRQDYTFLCHFNEKPCVIPEVQDDVTCDWVDMLTWTLSSVRLLCQQPRRFCDTAGRESPLLPKHLRHHWLLPLSLQTPGFALTGPAAVLWHSAHPAHDISKASTHADEVTVCVKLCSRQALCASTLT